MIPPPLPESVGGGVTVEVGAGVPVGPGATVGEDGGVWVGNGVLVKAGGSRVAVGVAAGLHADRTNGTSKSKARGLVFIIFPSPCIFRSRRWHPDRPHIVARMIRQASDTGIIRVLDSHFDIQNIDFDISITVG